MRIFLTISVFALVFAAYHHGYDKGHAIATKAALSTDPVSEELELICAGLWIGEQNKKYVEKDRARKH